MTSAPSCAEPTVSSQASVLPIVTDQFATVTLVTNEEIRRSGAATLGDLLFSKPGITGSAYAPGVSSRRIIRSPKVNRVAIVENGIGGNGASDLGEDHFIPVDPFAIDQVEVIRGPATMRYGSQSIGGVVSASNNCIPEVFPTCAATPFRTYGLPTKKAATVGSANWMNAKTVLRSHRWIVESKAAFCSMLPEAMSHCMPTYTRVVFRQATVLDQSGSIQ